MEKNFMVVSSFDLLSRASSVVAPCGGGVRECTP